MVSKLQQRKRHCVNKMRQPANSHSKRCSRERDRRDDGYSPGILDRIGGDCALDRAAREKND
jgi:hypothetical protein